MDAFPYEEKLRMLDFLSLTYRRTRLVAVDVFKCLHGINKTNCKSMLPLDEADGITTSGNCMKLKKQVSKGQLRPNIFRVVNMWNTLHRWSTALRGYLIERDPGIRIDNKKEVRTLIWISLQAACLFDYVMMMMKVEMQMFDNFFHCQIKTSLGCLVYGILYGKSLYQLLTNLRC